MIKPNGSRRSAWTDLESVCSVAVSCLESKTASRLADFETLFNERMQEMANTVQTRLERCIQAVQKHVDGAREEQFHALEELRRSVSSEGVKADVAELRRMLAATAMGLRDAMDIFDQRLQAVEAHGMDSCATQTLKRMELLETTRLMDSQMMHARFAEMDHMLSNGVREERDDLKALCDTSARPGGVRSLFHRRSSEGPCEMTPDVCHADPFPWVSPVGKRRNSTGNVTAWSWVSDRCGQDCPQRLLDAEDIS